MATPDFGNVNYETDDIELKLPNQTTTRLNQHQTNYYQILHRKSGIEGPFTPAQIEYKIVSKEIKDDILWVRPCERLSRWYQLDLNPLNQLCNDSSFNSLHSTLKKSLIRVKQLNLFLTDKYPKDENTKTDIFNIINWILFVIVGLHGIIILPFGLLPFYCKKCSYSLHGSCFIIGCLIWTIHCIATSLIIIYFVFIYTNMYNEIQSWMIAYIAWISVINIQWICDGIMSEYKYEKGKIILTKFRIMILGMKLKVKKGLFQDWRNDFWMVPISSLLPAAVIGFLANYFLEEKFLLTCHKSLEIGDICYNDDTTYACCNIISSYDLRNIFDFSGGLASNILASIGVIRFVAWFMVKKHRKLRHITIKKR